MTKSISVKELRMNFPKVIKDLEEGHNFTIIYRSKPVAMLSPIKFYSKPFGKLLDTKKIDGKKLDLPKDMKDFLDNIDKYSFKIKGPIDAVKLIRKDRGYED